jgi:large subunit ribosomal protein L9
MRVVFLEDVSGVAQGGDVKEVKNGFARNFLIPKSLATPATHNALQRVERLKKQADETRLKVLADTRALAEALDGVQVNIEMRTGASGRLYGSVTSAMIANELSELTEREIDRRTVQLPESIRELGTFDINLRLHPEVEAGVKVLVYAAGTDPFAEPEEPEDGDGEGEDEEERAGDAAPVAEIAETGDETAEESTEEAEESDSRA